MDTPRKRYSEPIRSVLITRASYSLKHTATIVNVLGHTGVSIVAAFGFDADELLPALFTVLECQ